MSNPRAAAPSERAISEAGRGRDRATHLGADLDRRFRLDCIEANARQRRAGKTRRPRDGRPVCASRHDRDLARTSGQDEIVAGERRVLDVRPDRARSGCRRRLSSAPPSSPPVGPKIRAGITRLPSSRPATRGSIPGLVGRKDVANQQRVERRDRTGRSASSSMRTTAIADSSSPGATPIDIQPTGPLLARSAAARLVRRTAALSTGQCRASSRHARSRSSAMSSVSLERHPYRSHLDAPAGPQPHASRFRPVPPTAPPSDAAITSAEPSPARATRRSSALPVMCRDSRRGRRCSSIPCRHPPAA